MNKVVYLIAGRMGSGKNTLGNALVKEYQANNIPITKTYAFADAIKAEGMTISWIRDQVIYYGGWDNAKRYSPVIRLWMQNQSLIRKAKDLYSFARELADSIDFTDPDPVIITDLRFLYELDYILSLIPKYLNMKIVVLWMRRTPENNTELLAHESEKLCYGDIKNHCERFNGTAFQYICNDVRNHEVSDMDYPEFMKCAAYDVIRYADPNALIKE